MTTRRGSKPETNRDEARTERIPLGVAKLTMSIDQTTADKLKSEGLVPRWINDVGGRIQDAVAGGYNFVESEGVKLGDAKQEQETDRRISKRVGTAQGGAPIMAYLMAIKEEWYREDQERKEEINMQVDKAIMGGKPPGLPDHGMSAEHGETSVKNVSYQP